MDIEDITRPMTAARRYEFYFHVAKTIFYERAQRVSKILFFTTALVLG